MGENGVVGRASDAVEESKNSKAKEEVSMAWSGATSEYFEDRAINLSKKVSDYYTKKVIDKYLAETGSLVEDPIENEGIYTVKYYSAKDKLVYIFEITSNEILLKGSEQYIPLQASAIATTPEKYYGKTVKYEANGITDWKIFYSNETNIFLITSDYLPNDKVSEEVEMTKNGKYQVFWWLAPTKFDTTSQNSLFMIEGYTLNGSNSNSKCVSKLINTEKWSNFVNDNYADYAIGAPTIEMWIASWNGKYSMDKIKCKPSANSPSSSGFGYKVDWESENYSKNYIVMDEKDGYNDTLYYPYKEEYQSCKGYWLASPQAEKGDYIMYVDCTGAITRSYYNSNRYNSVRPVVSLKSTVELIPGSGGYDFELK